MKFRMKDERTKLIKIQLDIMCVKSFKGHTKELRIIFSYLIFHTSDLSLKNESMLILVTKE
jgi:3-keto-L-gulonate-6-phosphate decarboxylase